MKRKLASILGVAGLTAALLSALLVAGCGGPSNEPGGGNFVDRSDMKIVAFSFSLRGTSSDSFKNYGLVREGDSALFTADFISRDAVEVLVGAEELDRLSEIVAKHGLDRWNGFEKSNSMVLDGSSFNLSYEYEDGFIVSARGNNSFPKGFGEAEADLLALFEGLLEQYDASSATGIS